MGLTTTNEEKLRRVFLSIYTNPYNYSQLKRDYRTAASKLNISGCTGCQINQTFRSFIFEAEDMTPEDIKVFLNSKSAPTMTAPKPTTADVTEAATSKVSKLTLAQVKNATAAKRKKATLAAKKKAAAAKKIDIAKKAITDRKLPGNIKFLYIPTKK